MKIKTKILNSLIKVYDAAPDCEMQPEFLETIDTELSILSEYFQTSKNQALFITVIMVSGYSSRSLDKQDLGRYLYHNPMRILDYNDDIEHLIKVNILTKEENQHSRPNLDRFKNLVINEKIIEALVLSKPMPDLLNNKFENVMKLLEKLDSLCDDRSQKRIRSAQLFSETKKLIDQHIHFPLIQKIKSLRLKQYDNYLFHYIIWQVINGDQQTALGRTVENMFEDVNIRLGYMQKFYKGTSKLLKNEWVELEKTNYFNHACLSLTEKSTELLSQAGIDLFTDDVKNENILNPGDIPERELIFSETEMKQVFLLKDLLKPEKLNEIQERLSQKNMPKGLTVLLHGAPGTGKTEIVKQLARETGRDLMKIDISQSKSMWFGESEKIVKRIFTDYKAYAKKCKTTPILFFNEADAILSKRQNSGASNVAQTENAIQNILLEEIENFEGILFATTNLITNLDNAFDRRFLFKINFPKPNASIKARIWKLKLPDLSNTECERLAAQFHFSGGQIDNIVRKTEMREILYQEAVVYGRVLDFCEEENFGEERIRIGF